MSNEENIKKFGQNKDSFNEKIKMFQNQSNNNLKGEKKIKIFFSRTKIN